MSELLSTSQLIDKSRIIAEISHRGQKRKFGNKEAYINHPERVSKIVKDKYPFLTDLQSLALLHDVIEDTRTTKQDLLDNNIPDWLIIILDLLTHQEGENYFDYIVRISQSSYARKVKLADLEDNMSDLKEGSLKDKYRFAHHFLSEIEKKKKCKIY